MSYSNVSINTGLFIVPNTTYKWLVTLLCYLGVWVSELTGETPQILHWASDQPNSWNGLQRCIAINKNDGQYYDGRCTSEHQGMCKIKGGCLKFFNNDLMTSIDNYLHILVPKSIIKNLRMAPGSTENTFCWSTGLGLLKSYVFKFMIEQLQSMLFLCIIFFSFSLKHGFTLVSG